MSKKNFVRNARIVKGARWVIDFLTYDPVSGIESRLRKDFLLNDITDELQRELVATHLIKVLDQIPNSVNKKQVVSENTVTVEVALTQALKAKSRLRPDSVRTYGSVAKQFLSWAVSHSYASLPVSEFSKKHIKSYTDWCRDQFKYRERTMNNKLNAMQAIWSEIEEREHVDKNIWLKAKRGRVEPKLRRAFADHDKITLANYIQEHEYWLYKAVLLLFFCYIRQSEMCRLRFRDFNLESGTVTITEYQAKTHKKRIVTIPESILHHFRDGQFDHYPISYFVFGAMWVPNATKALDPDSIYKKHVRILQVLSDRGDILDISGYTMYSWKDTGISLHARKTSALSTKDQAGHSDMAMTMKYYHSETLNKEYQALDDDLHS